MNQTTNATIQQIYDEVPYPSHPYSQTHPDYLATLAKLFGLSPVSLDQCRVLEIGCGTGGNLIPMSDMFPHSHFIGIDISPRQIAMGKQTIAALGLTNIELKQGDILDFAADAGKFDYIIAHGFYSWVPAEVQDRLLEICQNHLAPNGIAYISYNTYPGWHMFGMLREMMLYHTWQWNSTHTRAAKARELLDMLAVSIPEEHQAFNDFLSHYLNFLQRKIDQAGDQKDAFLLHDELAEYNTPVYFYQFVQHAARFGLHYVTETDTPGVMPHNFPPETAQRLQQMAHNVIDMEQYMDFLRGRTFRETLLCHHTLSPDRRLNTKHVRDFQIAAPAKPISSEPDIISPATEQFRSSKGGTIAIGHPLCKAAMVVLAEHWPHALDFDMLVAKAWSRLPDHMWNLQDEHVLAATLLKMYTYNTHLVQFRIHTYPFGNATDDYPTARPLARLQAQHERVVTNLLHERVKLDETQQAIVRLLDGTHDRAALCEAIPGLTADKVEEQLLWLAGKAILVARE